MATIGYKSYVGFGIESSFGTLATPTDYLEYNSESFDAEIDEILVEAINGTAQYTKRVTGNKSVAGSLEFPLIPSTALKIFNNGIGVITSTSISAISHKHTFLGRVGSMDSSTDSLSFQCGRDTDNTETVYNYTGCKTNALTIGNNVGEIVQCTAEFIAQDVAEANTISTASYSTESPYTFIQGTIKIGDTVTDATSSACVEAVSFTIGNNLVENRCIGSNLVSEIIGGIQDVNFEITATFDSPSLYNRFINGTKSYLSIEFEGSSITSTENHKITIDAANCYFNGSNANVGGPSEILNATYPIRAIHESYSMSSVRVVVISDQTTVST